MNNLDDERGNWVINFNFFKSGSSNIEATDSPSIWLYPHTPGSVIGIGRMTTREFLDSMYSCNYVVASEPTKQICRDVTKYREVIKTRTVTRYRTEQKCE